MTRGEPYVYDELHGSNTIRVFDLSQGSKSDPLHGHLREVELIDDAEHPPPYTALSYTWGSPHDISHEILIDSRTFKVRANLEKALLALRDVDKTVTLWIDGICIDQEKIYEKNHQVGMMAKIYRMAERTSIWLGAASSDSAIAFEFINMQSYHDDNLVSLSPARMDALRALLDRPYWHRAWILQEVLLSSEIDLHCGGAVASWDAFTETCKMLRGHLPGYVLDGPTFHLVDQRLALSRGDHRLTNQTLESLIRSYSSASATDVRDKVFALLSLACDCVGGGGLQADYGLPRFRLLINVLEFCKPDDPVELVNILFQAFAKDSHDEAWRTACESWSTYIATRNGTLARPRHNLNFPSKYLATIHHFVTEVSSSWNGVRLREPQINAFIDLGLMNATSAELHSLIERARLRDSAKYDHFVYRVDAQNWVMVVSASQVAIFSSSELSAIVKPCRSLGLHVETESCTHAKCSQAWRIIRIPAR